MSIPSVGQVISALYTKLSGDSTLTALLGTYSSSTCIFEGPMIPSSAPRPYVSIRPLKSFQTFDTKNYTASTFTIDIVCFTDERETTLILEQIYSRIINLLHRQELTMTDDNVFIELSNSTEVPTDENIVGHLLTFTLIVQ